MLVSALCIFGFVAALSAQSTPVVDAREAKQSARIQEGVQSGELTKREAAKLRANQRHIKRTEARAKADGVVTPAERAQLDRKQDKASKRILREKNDKQDRN